MPLTANGIDLETASIRSNNCGVPLVLEGRMPYPRITVDPNACIGKSCIRGLRFQGSRLLGLLAARKTRGAILADYPYLEAEDIDEALRYAASLAEHETIALARGNMPTD